MTDKKEVVWIKSPITGRDMVIQEFYDSTGVSKMDISSGYYTNELQSNYKRYPNNDILDYENEMPDSIKKLRFDDGESYWYPSVIQTEEEVVFPTGDRYEDITWHHGLMVDSAFGKTIDETTIKNYSSYLEAAKQMKGYSLGNI